MSLQTIAVYRASKGTMNGEISDLGLHTFTVDNVVIYTHVVCTFGNGSPTPVLSHDPMSISYVLIGTRRYVVQPARPMTDAYRSITIHHDEVFACTTCGQPVTKQTCKHLCPSCGQAVAHGN